MAYCYVLAVCIGLLALSATSDAGACDDTCDMSTHWCFHKPKGICFYPNSPGKCPDTLCLAHYESGPCEHRVCPLTETCSPSPYNQVAGLRYQCSSRLCKHVCMGNEVCVKDHLGRAQCVNAINENGALYDGFNVGGRFVPCTEHHDCYDYREPVEWYCCMNDHFQHKWSTSGAHCDSTIGACVIERFELGRLRWTLAERTASVRNAPCSVVCPCCQ